MSEEASASFEDFKAKAIQKQREFFEKDQAIYKNLPGHQDSKLDDFIKNYYLKGGQKIDNLFKSKKEVCTERLLV